MAGLYVHIPFCRSKCAYCDFFSQPSASAAADYVDAVLAEANLRRHEISDTFSTLYIGGGTPSLLSYELLEKLIAGLTRTFASADFNEITIEANPEDITPASVKYYKSIGINRISVGVQSFNPILLEKIGRRHSAHESHRALEILKKAAISFNADLIYGLPTQTSEQFADDLSEMLKYEPPHLSAYLLQYEPGTPLFIRMHKGLVEETDEITANDMYQLLCNTLKKNGYLHYEISNFSKPGLEAKHNSSYWDYTPYLGLGCSAHSFDGVTRRWNPSHVKGYIQSIREAHETGPESLPYKIDLESAENRLNDYIITSLRTTKGLDFDFISGKFAPDLIEKLKCNIRMHPQGLSISSNRVAIIESSWLNSDAILRNIIVE